MFIVLIAGVVSLLYVVFRVYVVLYTEYLLYNYKDKIDEAEFNVFVTDCCKGYSWSTLQKLKKYMD